MSVRRRVPIVIYSDDSDCSDVNDEINRSKLSLEHYYESELDRAYVVTTTSAIATANISDTTSNNRSRDNSDKSDRYSNKYNKYSFVTFLRVNMRAAIIGVIGVLVIQFAGTLGISTKVGDIIVEIDMPTEAEEGSTIELKCDWRILTGIGLYSVKWYKDDHEFFQYVPDNSPQIQTFEQAGIQLEKRINNEKSIKLVNVKLETSGQYKCEVSTEGPTFAVSIQSVNLTVISLPERGPEIMGLNSHYGVGENVTANCMAWPSVPKADLRWTINGEKVSADNTVQNPPLSAVNSKGIPNSLGLRLEAEPRHFGIGGGLVKIKCIAKVGSRVFETEKRVQMAYVNNQRLSAGDLRSNVPNLNDHRLLYGPIISIIVIIIITT